MQVTKTHPTIGDITFVYATRTIARLEKTCFRGRNNRLAGNFSLWESLMKLFSDSYILDEFLTDIEDVWKDGTGDLGTKSLTIEYTEPVGWENTDELSRYRPEELEAFNPTPRSAGLRVLKTLLTRKAPLTADVTIVYQLKKGDNDEPVVLIWSVYPGFDIGEVRGDVTAREERVFFDWNHPGA